jgi:uncharacterized protein HemX
LLITDLTKADFENKKLAEVKSRITTHLTNMKAKGYYDIDVIILEIPNMEKYLI